MKPRVSGYQLVREVAQRAQESLWNAIDGETGKNVVLTISNAPLVTSLEAFDRYLFALLSASVHPHLVTVHGGGITDEGHPFMVLEACAPAPESHPQAPKLDPAQVLPLMIRLASGVQHLHHAAVVHGAIERGNLFTPARGGVAVGGYPVDPDRHTEHVHRANPGTPHHETSEPCDLRDLAAMMWDLGEPTNFAVRLQTFVTAAITQSPQGSVRTLDEFITGLQRSEHELGVPVTTAITPANPFTELAGPLEASAHLDAVTHLRVIDPDTVTRIRAEGGARQSTWEEASLDAETRLRSTEQAPPAATSTFSLPAASVTEERGVRAFDPGDEQPDEPLYKPRATPPRVEPSSTTVQPPVPEPASASRDHRVSLRRTVVGGVIIGAGIIALSVAGILALL